MRAYLVTFRRIITDDAGRDRSILQRQAVVSACSDIAAAYAAKAMLCETDGVIDWRLRADTCEVSELSAHAA